jgi:hypothetical protein
MIYPLTIIILAHVFMLCWAAYEVRNSTLGADKDVMPHADGSQHPSPSAPNPFQELPSGAVSGQRLQAQGGLEWPVEGEPKRTAPPETGVQFRQPSTRPTTNAPSPSAHRLAILFAVNKILKTP